MFNKILIANRGENTVSPNRLAVVMMQQAISPRLAIKIFVNICNGPFS